MGRPIGSVNININQNTSKICSICKTKLNTNNMSKFRLSRKDYRCNKCYREYQINWRWKNRKRIRENIRDIYTKITIETFKHYSPKLICQKCGFSDRRALSIDHISGGGNKHRKELKHRSGSGFYRWLKSKGYPIGYQVLCMNCQFIKRHENNEQGRPRKND